MPELPEIEHLKRTLEPVLTKATVYRVRLYRRDVLACREPQGGSSQARGCLKALLIGGTITRLERRGKQLAIMTEDGRSLCVHLGMSGQLRFLPARRRMPDTSHVHCVWGVESASGRGRLAFRDPRRFGGLWAFASAAELHRERWSRLGPDALTISAPTLARRLRRTRRPIKAALLDQSLVAGMGNIYADESLFNAGLHPLTPSYALEARDAHRLAGSIRGVLRRAVAAGGSTIRSYVDANGNSGGFVSRHRVYGRGGQPCLNCGDQLQTMTVAQRTTVACNRCQRGAVREDR